MMSKWTALTVVLVLVGMVHSAMGAGEVVKLVEKPDVSGGNDYYVGNREPLLASPFVKLPIGAIEPQGWVRKQLELEADGFTGHLTEISKFLKKENNAWLSSEGVGDFPWEEMPYWLKGFGDLGYILGNERIIKEAKIWIEGFLGSQREDGYFGPRANLRGAHGPGGERAEYQEKPDVWPNMIVLNCLQSYYEWCGDKRVLAMMSKYFRWELTVPDDIFLEPFWQQQRASDNLASIYWLYNRTGEEFLLEVAEKVHRNTANWTADVANWHGVNISQCFRGPTVFYQQSKEDIHLIASERNYQKVMGMYGQVPGGMFGADENCRAGYVGPRQAAETCTMAEYMLSFEMLTKITGDPLWLDRCEDVTFNSLPASMTADLKALHYLTAPNMILCDRHSKSPGFENDGAMLLFNPHYHRCCQHNVGHAWPRYAEHLWLATPGNGLAAVLYAPCKVKAKVGDGTTVTITEKTKYPFEEKIELEIATGKVVRFPLYLRVPGWCEAQRVSINGRAIDVGGKGRSYIMIDREWTDGDKVLIVLPMEVTLTTWKKNKNGVSVNRGPLTYSLKIGEKHVRAMGTDTDKWPAWEIHPASAWNYGLVLDDREPKAQFKVTPKEWPRDDQPFDVSAAPIELEVRAKKIPGWEKDHLGLVGSLQESPAISNEPVEMVTLIPMGCARLRISAFPTIGSGTGAHEWVPPKVD